MDGTAWREFDGRGTVFIGRHSHRGVSREALRGVYFIKGEPNFPAVLEKRSEIKYKKKFF